MNIAQYPITQYKYRSNPTFVVSLCFVPGAVKIWIDCKVYLWLFSGGFTSCSPNAFQCADGSCIPLEYYCDGYENCPDGYDEHLCQTGLCILWFVSFTFHFSLFFCILTQITFWPILLVSPTWCLHLRTWPMTYIWLRMVLDVGSALYRQIVRCSTDTQHIWQQEFFCRRSTCLEQPASTLTRWRDLVQQFQAWTKN